MEKKKPEPKKPTATRPAKRKSAEVIAFPADWQKTERGLRLLNPRGLAAIQAVIAHAERDGATESREALEAVLKSLLFLGEVADGKMWARVKIPEELSGYAIPAAAKKRTRPAAKKPGGKK